MKYDIDSINKRKKNMEVVRKILGIILIVIVYNIILTFISSISSNNGTSIFGYKACIITSNSMEPTINCDDVVIIKKCEEKDLYTGDIITFQQNQESITHRILKIEKDSSENANVYITKGDNNNTEDVEKTNYSQIQGKYVIAIPQLGKIILMLDNKLIVLIIILILLILCFFKVSKQEKIENRREKKKIEDKKRMEG